MLLSSEVIPLYSKAFCSHKMVLKINLKKTQIKLTNETLTKQCYCLVEMLMLCLFPRLLLMTASLFFFSNILKTSNDT